MAEPEAVTPSEPVTPPPEEDLSLSDHESRFSAEARQHPQEAPVETPPPEPAAEDTPHADDTDDAGPRDEKGRFLPKPKSPLQRLNQFREFSSSRRAYERRRRSEMR